MSVFFFNLLYHLTINQSHSAVLVTLRLAVELVGVALAEAHFVGHAQADGGVKGPDGGLACAGLGHHGQTAHSWGDRTEDIFMYFQGCPFLYKTQIKKTKYCTDKE